MTASSQVPLSTQMPLAHVTAHGPHALGELVVLSGMLRVNDSDMVGAAELALFERAGERTALESVGDTKALLLSGEPIHEPIVGRGPFVMNTQEEIRQAMLDYQSGRLGHL